MKTARIVYLISFFFQGLFLLCVTLFAMSLSPMLLPQIVSTVLVGAVAFWMTWLLRLYVAMRYFAEKMQASIVKSNSKVEQEPIEIYSDKPTWE